jgi:hypothetical protein
MKRGQFGMMRLLFWMTAICAVCAFPRFAVFATVVVGIPVALFAVLLLASKLIAAAISNHSPG